MDWVEGDVEVHGVPIHYYRRGRGPVVVLAHGVTDNGRCWDRVAAQLEDAFELIAYDAPLHGQSGGDADAMQRRGETLVGLVEALGLESPMAIGHSMGAGAVSEALASRPDLFPRAVLEDPGWWDEERLAEMRAAIGPAGAAAAGTGGTGGDTSGAPPTIEQIIARGREQNPTWHAEEFPGWALAKTQYRGVRSTPKSTWREQVPKFACPVLVIAGDPERGSIVGADSEKEAAAMCASVTVVRLPTGHNVRREAFEEFVELVTEFLRA